MDNFRKFKAAERKSASGIDGFVGAGSRYAGRSASVQRIGDQRTQRPVDNFQGRQGFTPNQQPVLETSAPSVPHAAPRRHSGNIQPPGIPSVSAPKVSRLRRKKRTAGSKEKGTRNWRKIILRSAIGLFVASLLIGGFLVGKGYLKVRGIFKGGGSAPALAENVDPTKLNGEGDGRVNILMLGKGGEGHDGADLTDTILVASIDPLNKNASILSIPRDLWVKNPSGGQSKINAVYANAKYSVLAGKKTADIKQRAEQAGMSAIESTVESTMGIPIHYYVMVDFVGFEKAINTVGGIDIYVDPKDDSSIVKETLWDEMTGKNYTLNVQPGNNHFDGQRALMYSRSRHTSNRGDFDRAVRQRKVLIALKDRVLSVGTFGNPVKINQLISDFGNHVQSNMNTAEVMRIYEISKTIDSSKIGSVGLADPPNNFVQTDNINGQSIVRPRAGLFDYSQIQNYVRNTLKDGFIQNENASIAVYNGSGIDGLAGTKATELKSFGYNITTIANAPNPQAQTVLVDLTNDSKKYTKHYLEKRLGVTSSTGIPSGITVPQGTDFVIILGKNESSH
jgi:LCP family protein required for cell wall assembly